MSSNMSQQSSLPLPQSVSSSSTYSFKNSKFRLASFGAVITYHIAGCLEAVRRAESDMLTLGCLPLGSILVPAVV